jgi:hypothetical protein
MRSKNILLTAAFGLIMSASLTSAQTVQSIPSKNIPISSVPFAITASGYYVLTGNLTTGQVGPIVEAIGESAKDAAGNTVKLRSQQGQESKSLTELHASFSQAALKGLVVVSSEVSQNGQEFTLIMALTQKSLNQATAVANALSGSTPKPGSSAAESDRPNPESMVNQDVLDDLR